MCITIVNELNPFLLCLCHTDFPLVCVQSFDADIYKGEVGGKRVKLMFGTTTCLFFFLFFFPY